MSERIALDAYYTPDALALECLATLHADIGSDYRTAIEPSCGGGAFVRALRKLCPAIRVLTCDIDQNASGRGDQHITCDFLDFRGRGELIVGNPPFSAAESHVRHAMGLVRREDGCVAFLLRLAFLESKQRLPFWREFPPTEVHVVVPRPSFTGGGSDTSAYGWFVWAWHAGELMHPQGIRWLAWQEQTATKPIEQGALF